MARPKQVRSKVTRTGLSRLKKTFLSIHRKAKGETKSLVSERDKTSLTSEIKVTRAANIETPSRATNIIGAANIESPSRAINIALPTQALTKITNGTLQQHEPKENKQNRRPSKAITEEFMRNAHIRAFDPSWIPPCVRPDSFNNDLELASFMPGRYTWAGEQRKGMICHITDSKDPEDHTRKAMDLEFFIAKEAPLPSEVMASLEFIQT